MKLVEAFDPDGRALIVTDDTYAWYLVDAKHFAQGIHSPAYLTYPLHGERSEQPGSDS